MQEQLQRFIARAVAHKKLSIAFIGLSLATAGLITLNMPANDSLAAVGAAEQRIGMPEIEIITVSATSTAGAVLLNESWPGELVSLGNVPVQPAREGTIASWSVYIGQKVSAGQVLGTLSQPPAMPDTIAMLAEEEKMVTMARVSADAKRIYTKERLVQLEALRANTERSLTASRTILGGDAATTAGSANFSMIEAKKQTIRAMLRESLATTYPMLSLNITLPTQWNAITLKDTIGVQNSRLRNDFPSVLFAALTDLNAPEKLPITSGLAYFDLAIKLSDASLPDSMLMDADLIALKSMLHKDQESFIMAVDKLREAELMAVDTEKMSFEQSRMIDSEIAMLKQDLAMAEGDVLAKEASYRTVQGATEGGIRVVAPKSGTVSSILKKPGEFVMPGTPVAVITGTTDDAIFVRMRLPSNIRLPQVGAILSVVRTGFSQDAYQAKLIGIGSALDETGSVMADAMLLESTDWPVGASVRVFAGAEMANITIKPTALWWDAQGKPNVWAVSPLGRVYAKQLSLGRTVGEEVEVSSGLSQGERYIAKPRADITEDMLLSDISAPKRGGNTPEAGGVSNPHAGHAGMEGMEM